MCVDLYTCTIFGKCLVIGTSFNTVVVNVICTMSHTHVIMYSFALIYRLLCCMIHTINMCIMNKYIIIHMCRCTNT